MTSEPSPIISDETAFPPRFRALKRSTITLLVLILALGSQWLWWSHDASSRLQLRIAEIAPRGEPLYPGDFAESPSIQPEQNAATYLKLAIDQLNRDAEPPGWTGTQFKPRLPRRFDAIWHPNVAKAARWWGRERRRWPRHTRRAGVDRASWGIRSPDP